MRRIFYLIIAALVGITGSAAGQNRAEISLGGGMTQPTGDFGNAAKLGWHGMGAIAWFPQDVFGLQATGFYGQNNFDPSGGKYKIFGGLAEFRLDLRTEAPFRPYVMAGGGLMNVKTNPSGGGSSSDTKGAFGGGVGLSYVGASKVGFFLQVRWVNVFFSGPDLAFIPVSAGVRISLQ